MSFDFEELGEQLIKLRKSKMTQKELKSLTFTLRQLPDMSA